MLLLAYLAVVVAVAAPLCGHVGEAWPPGVWWRAWRSTSARRSRTPSSEAAP